MHSDTVLQADDFWTGDYLEPLTACLYCGSKRADSDVADVADWFFGNVPGYFAFNRCLECRSLWLEKCLTDTHLTAAYTHYYTHAPSDKAGRRGDWRAYLRAAYGRAGYGKEPGVTDRAMAALYRRMAPNLIELDAKHRFAPRAPARILDYGCGGGEYLRQMRALGYDVMGVDFDPVAVASLQAGGISATLADDFAWSAHADHFDCVTLSHVIEHVPDPIGLLRNVATVLRTGGTVYIEAPNALATGLAIFGRYWRGLEAPRHLGIPSPAGISVALRQAGLSETRRLVRTSVRGWLWQESLPVVEAADRDAILAASQRAPVETLETAEFITLVATKQVKQ